MMKTTQAAVVERFGQPLVLREWEVPLPGPGQILVKTEACGVCHTDLHAARGEFPVQPGRPSNPGHEGIGRVAAVGAGVTAAQEGDRVGVPWPHSACGHCEHCLAALETVCSGAHYSGYSRNGGSAEFILADANYVAHIPADHAAPEAAPIICAGITSYKGIKETGARPGEWIAISGAGGLGHRAVQYAKAMGLHICVIDIDNGKLAHATRLGADVVINARDAGLAGAAGAGGLGNSADLVAGVRKATDGGAHGVLITAPSLGAFQQGVRMTRKRGTCVLVGLPPGEFALPRFDVVANCITVRGSFVGTRQDMVEAPALAADAQVQADIELQPLSGINHVFDRLERGEVASRMVLDFTLGDGDRDRNCNRNASDRPSSARWS